MEDEVSVLFSHITTDLEAHCRLYYVYQRWRNIFTGEKT